MLTTTLLATAPLYLDIEYTAEIYWNSNDSSFELKIPNLNNYLELGGYELYVRFVGENDTVYQINTLPLKFTYGPIKQIDGFGFN